MKLHGYTQSNRKWFLSKWATRSKNSLKAAIFSLKLFRAGKKKQNECNNAAFRLIYHNSPFFTTLDVMHFSIRFQFKGKYQKIIYSYSSLISTTYRNFWFNIESNNFRNPLKLKKINLPERDRVMLKPSWQIFHYRLATRLMTSGLGERTRNDDYESGWRALFSREMAFQSWKKYKRIH